IGAEVSVLVSRAELDAGVFGRFVVETIQDQRRAELSVIKQVPCDFVIGIDPDLKVWCDPLHNSRIEVVRTFRQDRALLKGFWLSRGVGERSDVGRRGDRLWRRRKVACIAGVERR